MHPVGHRERRPFGGGGGALTVTAYGSVTPVLSDLV
jgi:hypothetical protein